MSRSTAAPKIAPDRIHEFLSDLFVDSMHARRVLSLGNAVIGAIHAAALGVHAIGKALATASGLEPKHAITQVDRLLSNMSLSVWELFPLWVRFLLSQRQEVFVALDWTDFDADGHSVIALNMITSHGRATPLMWKTHEKSKLKQHRNDYEDNLLEALPLHRAAGSTRYCASGPWLRRPGSIQVAAALEHRLRDSVQRWHQRDRSE
ncbi:MAG: hypothetical protein ABI895_38845 [Deltaproteobacteria bacterium]